MMAHRRPGIGKGGKKGFDKQKVAAMIKRFHSLRAADFQRPDCKIPGKCPMMGKGKRPGTPPMVHAQKRGKHPMVKDKGFGKAMGRKKVDGKRPGAVDRFKKADKNGDGQLSLDEVSPKLKKHFKAIDTDADGQLTKKELKTFFKSKAKDKTKAEGKHRKDGPKHKKKK